MQYPNLLAMLKTIASDNDLRLLPENEIRWPSESKQLEEAAAKLNADEQWVLACGEESEQQAIYKTLNTRRWPHIGERLNEFLNEAFDGFLCRNFYRDF